MRRKQNFTKAIGVYFFNIKTGHNSTITISRKTKEEALYAYTNYVKQKKDIEWLGKWDGKKYTDSDVQIAA